MVEATEGRFTIAVMGGFATCRYAQLVPLRPSARRLVALLAIEGTAGRLDAATRLWTDLPQDRSMANLRTVVWRLRQDSPGLILQAGDTLELAADDIDFLSVRRWAHAAIAGEDTLWPVPEHAARELLPGWSDTWLTEPREELHLVQLHALEATARRFMMAGRMGEACSQALAAVRMDPLRESATRLLVEIHLREGNNHDAIRRFRRFERHLKDQVEGGPSPALVALVSHLLGTR